MLWRYDSFSNISKTLRVLFKHFYGLTMTWKIEITLQRYSMEFYSTRSCVQKSFAVFNVRPT